MVLLLLVVVALAAAIGANRLLWTEGSGGKRRGLLDVVGAAAERMPGPGSGAYRAPTADEAADLAALTEALAAGNEQEARLIATALGLEVDTIREGDRDLLMVRERETGDRGWGLLVVDPVTDSRVVVEAPHPVADRGTEDVAARTFLASDARALVLAGASREALPGGRADVAHRRDSAFQVMHRALVAPGDLVLQVHGFDAETRGDTYGDVVLSSGTESPGSVVTSLSTRLGDADIDVCVYDGERCRDLAGTTNVQGRSTRAADARFVHVELSAALRDTVAARASIAQLLAQVEE